ncbi:GntR family transcriptional regulator [Robbsia sp. Bb-Pol-6]|uniref:GntR family transcriptional regulator n=1 Tax=Robbsia betulipollinis TaxID=2981849 RepID=A0ABT3ZIA4_9BURK|nr:GntR family transcriptional regulator [Robbsia betulipollinis]MCY0386187.1 GntR family transcriptional regulator [Robbsia betulipollinis]
MDRRLPRYQLLRDQLAARIAALEWRFDEPLPTEQELAASYGLAVGTVRKAIDVLEKEGALSRFQGRGTFIRRANFDRSLLRFFRFLDARGRRQIPQGKIQSRKTKRPPAHVANALGIEAGIAALQLKRLRLIDAKPLVSEEIWLPLSRFGKLEKLPIDDFGNLLYPLYESLCGQVVARASERLTIDLANDSDIETLKLQDAGSVVVIERIAYGLDGSALEWRISRGNPGHFSYTVDIR